jgi:hypothetical protein
MLLSPTVQGFRNCSEYCQFYPCIPLWWDAICEGF